MALYEGKGFPGQLEGSISLLSELLTLHWGMPLWYCSMSMTPHSCGFRQRAL